MDRNKFCVEDTRNNEITSYNKSHVENLYKEERLTSIVIQYRNFLRFPHLKIHNNGVFTIDTHHYIYNQSI